MLCKPLQLSIKDPVFNIHLDKCVFANLEELCGMCGKPKFDELMAAIDPDISSQLQDFVIAT